MTSIQFKSIVKKINIKIKEEHDKYFDYSRIDRINNPRIKIFIGSTIATLNVNYIY